MDEKEVKTEVALADDEETAPDTDSKEYTPSHAKHLNKKDKRLKEKNSKKLEKLMKKQKRKEEHSHREVLSYEDMPLEELKEDVLPAKKKHHVKRIIAVAVIVLLLFTVVLFSFNTDKLTWHNVSNFIQYGVLNRRSEEHFPLDIKGVGVNSGNFIRMGQDVCYASDTKTQLLNNYGRSEFSHQHAFINPVLTVGKQGVLVYNLGGSGYQMIDKEGKLYSGTAEDNILLADYGDNGSYAIVTENSGYLSKLYVYDEKHEQIFAYSFADYYVTSVSLSSNGKSAVVSGVSALNGAEIASVYVLDFTKDTPLYFSEFEDNYIYSIEYLSEKYVCAVGRSASYIVNTDNGEVDEKSYEGSNLTAFDINTDTDTFTLSLSGSGDGRNCDIVTYAISGSEEKKFSVDEKVIDLSTYKGRVALLTGEKIMLYTKDGKSVSEKDVDSDPHKVVLYTTSDAYILCTGYIDVVSL